MRVIAGELRGRTLRTVNDLSVRPTTDRAKQVIFDVLATRVDLDGADVLDLFAGSGSLGIEALSRGARSAVFVERSTAALDMLEQNLRTLGLLGRSQVVRSDARHFLSAAGRSFPLVFADPPYDMEGIEELPTMVARSGAVAPGGWFVMEHRTSHRVEPDPVVWTVITKKLGQTIALLMRLAPAATQGRS